MACHRSRARPRRSARLLSRSIQGSHRSARRVSSRGRTRSCTRRTPSSPRGARGRRTLAGWFISRARTTRSGGLSARHRRRLRAARAWARQTAEIARLPTPCRKCSGASSRPATPICCAASARSRKEGCRQQRRLPSYPWSSSQLLSAPARVRPRWKRRRGTSCRARWVPLRHPRRGGVLAPLPLLPLSGAEGALAHCKMRGAVLLQRQQWELMQQQQEPAC